MATLPSPVAILALLGLLHAPAPAQSAKFPDLSGRLVDPFAGAAEVRVFLFARTDCPITNRYAPELRRIAKQFIERPVEFWLIYPDQSETPAHIRSSVEDYGFPGTPLRDPQRVLVRRAHASIAPEAAVFDATGHLRYHGRIDDRYLEIGRARPRAEVHDLEDAISSVLAHHPVKRSETRAVGCSLADLE